MRNTIITSSLLIYTFILFNTKWCTCNVNSPDNSSTVRCRPSERAALLNFKHNLTFLGKDVLSSWVGKECCQWRRVGCDNATSHVIKLDLNGNGANYFLQMDKLVSLVYLLELKQLQRLDLSYNDLGYNSIPKFMGSMNQLRYLNLSNSILGGMIPNELGNLTNLRVLDLGSTMMFDGFVFVENLGWISGLKELRYLNLNHVNMSRVYDWVESLNGPLPYIEEFQLSDCGLTLYKTIHKNSSFPEHLPIRYIDLSSNDFNGEIIPMIQNLTSLENPNLSYSINLTQYDSWSLWDLVHNLCSLKSLDLSYNYLVGMFLPPRQNLLNNCGNRYELEELSIIGSSVMGDIPGWLGDDFRSLTSIDLSGNFLSGEIPASLGKLSNLKEIDLFDNNLSSIASSLRFPPKLEYLLLGSNQLRGKIPKSLGKLSNLHHLDLSINPFQDTVLSEHTLQTSQA